MAQLKHPLSGAVYTLREDGLVDVNNHGLTGTFYQDGRHHAGPLRFADPHMLLWLAGPQLPVNAKQRQSRT